MLVDSARPKRALYFVDMGPGTDHEEFAEQLVTARSALGLSVEALASGAGVGVQTVKRGEAGKKLTPRTRGKLQAYLRIGPFANGRPGDPPLSEAEFPELMAALLNRYSVDIRAAKDSGHRDRFTADPQEELPGHVNLENDSDETDSG